MINNLIKLFLLYIDWFIFIIEKGVIIKQNKNK